jgi:wobble nucleotide-excising tRNase
VVNEKIKNKLYSMQIFFKTLRRILFLILIIFPLALFAQDDDQKMTKKQKKAHQKKEQRVQDAKKAEITGKKKHMKLQDKDTRKRMKKNKRKGNSYVSRRPGFFQRIMKPFR